MIFAIASISDLVDGYLARKWNQETELGKFLDPLADKFLVLGSFVAFLFLNEQIEVWMVAIILFRDMLITALRTLAIREGESLKTTMLGKVKTAFQMGTIIILLLLFILISGKRWKWINLEYREAYALGYTTFEVAKNNFKEFLERKDSATLNDLILLLGGFVPYFGMLFTTIITFFSGFRYMLTNYKLFLWQNLKKAFKN